MFVCDPRQNCCEGEFCVWSVVLQIVYQSLQGLHSDVAVVVSTVVSAAVNDEMRYVLWCSGDKILNVMCRGSAFKPNVWCMFPSWKVVVYVLVLTVSN